MVLYRVGEWPCWLVGGNGGSKRNHAVHMAAPVPGLIMGGLGRTPYRFKYIVMKATQSVQPATPEPLRGAL